MKVLNFGSLNIDDVYSVAHFVRPGETISSINVEHFCGGKGLNQSIALARAGAEVYHAGAVGKADGKILVEALEESGVHTDFVEQRDCDSGRAIIQLDSKGQNCILLAAGANRTINEPMIHAVLSHFSKNDILILQNEINMLEVIMHSAKEIGMKIVLNPSPMNEKILTLPLEMVDCFLLNEIEAMELCGAGCEDKNQMIERLCVQYPKAAMVLTCGKEGVIYRDSTMSTSLSHGTYKVDVVDTTAAGDTFTGFFVAAIAQGETVTEALHFASVASSLAVSRKGAQPSIPWKEEVINSRLQLEYKI